MLSYEYGIEHSWLCNSLERDAAEQLGVTPNSNGLIDLYDDADRVAEYANRDDVTTEPGLWLPWLIVQYPIVTG